MNKHVLIEMVMGLIVNVDGVLYHQHINHVLGTFYYECYDIKVFATPFFDGSEFIPYMVVDSSGDILDSGDYEIVDEKNIQTEYDNLVSMLIILHR